MCLPPPAARTNRKWVTRAGRAPSPPGAAAAFTPAGRVSPTVGGAGGVVGGPVAGVRGACGGGRLGLQEATAFPPGPRPGAGPGDPRRGGRAPRPPGLRGRRAPESGWAATPPPDAGGTSVKWGSAPQGGGPGPPIGLQLRPATRLRDRSSSLCPHAG